MGDDFTVPAGGGWQVDQMQFFAYQTGSTTTSTMNDIRVQIWNGDPTAGGTVIWGDLTTNGWLHLLAQIFTESIDTSPLDSNRPIMVQTATIGTTLACTWNILGSINDWWNTCFWSLGTSNYNYWYNHNWAMENRILPVYGVMLWMEHSLKDYHL